MSEERIFDPNGVEFSLKLGKRKTLLNLKGTGGRKEENLGEVLKIGRRKMSNVSFVQIER